MEKNEREDTEDNGSWEDDEIDESHQRKVGRSYLGNAGWATWRWAPAKLMAPFQ
ncbi:4636_t:CDS:1, partial [Funneliformis caledonium]